MNPEHKRIVELAAGWEGSAAVVTLSAADAALLGSVGCVSTPGARAGDPFTVAAPDLCAAAKRLASGFHATPRGAEPTPNTQSVTGPGTDPDLNGVTGLDGDEGTELDPTEPEDLDGMTVAELKALADGEGVDITGHAKKADIIAAIRLGREAAEQPAHHPDPEAPAMAQTPATTYQDGDRLDYTPGSAVAAGAVVLLGTVPLHADLDIPANTLGALSAAGVKRVPKVTGAIGAGDPIYWNPTASPVSGDASSGACGTAAAGGTLMGWAVIAAASGDAYALVKLLAVPAALFGRVPVNADVAATGSAQGDAAQVYEGFTVVTAGDGTKGVILPVATPGMRVEIKNGAAAVLKVYGKTGAAINALSANAAISLAANVPAIFVAKSATQWYTIPLLPS